MSKKIRTFDQNSNEWVGVEADSISNNNGLLVTPDNIGNVTSLKTNDKTIVGGMNELQTSLNDIVNDSAISPEQFTGNAKEKIQSAINVAIQNKKAVKFNKMYDITGLGSIKINKSTTNPDYDRRVLYLIGDGGGIIKNDVGVVFTSDYANTGDIAVRGMRYISTQAVGTVIWDCDKIIRLESSYNEYFQVDSIAKAEAKYFQSCSFTHEHIIQGKGWAFSFKESYDTTISNNLMEARENGIRNSASLNGQNRNLRIQDNLMEGFSGKAILIPSSNGVSIENNYFEGNVGGDIDLTSDVNCYHYGLRLIGNMFTLAQAQIDAGKAAINWGNIFDGYGGGAVSDTNVCNNGILHYIPTSNNGYISGRGDTGIGTNWINGKSGKYIYADYIKIKYTANGTLEDYGAYYKMYNSASGISVPANTIGTASIAFQQPVDVDDLVTIAINSPAYAQFLSYMAYSTSGITVWFKNTDTTGHSFDIYANVLRRKR